MKSRFFYFRHKNNIQLQLCPDKPVRRCLHMLIPISVASLLQKKQRRRRSVLPKLTPVSSGRASRFSWKTGLIAAGGKWAWKASSLSWLQFDAATLLKLIYTRIDSLYCQSSCCCYIQRNVIISSKERFHILFLTFEVEIICVKCEMYFQFDLKEPSIILVFVCF